MQNNNLPQMQNGQLQAVQTDTALVAAETARVQAQCVLALQNPRNVLQVENEILSMCQSKYLAAEAEYEYPKGSMVVTGPTIKLVSAIAQCYGNITTGWKEISRSKDRSKVVCWAWDIQKNFRNELEFEVPLYKEAKGTRTLLTSDRDIYERIANDASRRIRKCMENTIPRYLIDMAVEECRKTFNSSRDVKSDLKKTVNYLQSYHGVTLEDLETKLGMKYEAFGAVQLTTITKWANSLKNGMTTKEELFPTKDNKAKTVDEVKEQQIKAVGTAPKPVQQTPVNPVQNNVPPVDPMAEYAESEVDENGEFVNPDKKADNWFDSLK